MYKFNKIKKLKAAGKNISQIANEENLDWKTVQKYFNSDSPPQPVQRIYKTRPDPLIGFYDKILELKKIESLTKWDIFNELVNHEYKGSYHTVRRHLNSIDLPNKERYFEQLYEPGDQLQVDFKEDLEVYLEGKVNLPRFDGHQILW